MSMKRKMKRRQVMVSGADMLKSAATIAKTGEAPKGWLEVEVVMDLATGKMEVISDARKH